MLAFALTCWGALVTGQAWAGTADLILTNGRVYTDNAKSRWAEAVAVKSGKQGLQILVHNVGPVEAADFIVLDKDLFKIAPEEIANDKVLLTLFGGKELYRDASF